MSASGGSTCALETYDLTGEKGVSFRFGCPQALLRHCQGIQFHHLAAQNRLLMIYGERPQSEGKLWAISQEHGAIMTHVVISERCSIFEDTIAKAQSLVLYMNLGLRCIDQRLQLHHAGGCRHGDGQDCRTAQVAHNSWP